MRVRWEWCLRYGIGLGCVLGLLFLMIGCNSFGRDIDTTLRFVGR